MSELIHIVIEARPKGGFRAHSPDVSRSFGWGESRTEAHRATLELVRRDLQRRATPAEVVTLAPLAKPAFGPPMARSIVEARHRRTPPIYKVERGPGGVR